MLKFPGGENDSRLMLQARACQLGDRRGKILIVQIVSFADFPYGAWLSIPAHDDELYSSTDRNDELYSSTVHNDGLYSSICLPAWCDV